MPNTLEKFKSGHIGNGDILKVFFSINMHSNEYDIGHIQYMYTWMSYDAIHGNPLTNTMYMYVHVHTTVYLLFDDQNKVGFIECRWGVHAYSNFATKTRFKLKKTSEIRLSYKQYKFVCVGARKRIIASTHAAHVRALLINRGVYLRVLTTNIFLKNL